MFRDHRLIMKQGRGGSAFIAAVIAMLFWLPTSAWAENREFNMTIDEVQIQVAPDLKYNVFAFDGIAR